MAVVERVKRLHHRWTRLFELVADVEAYPAFVPHCRSVRLLSRKVDALGRTNIVSRMTVGASAFQVSYANRTVADANNRQITVEALDGPLRYLSVIWKFTPVGDDRTDIEFTATYEFNSRVLAALASRLFIGLSSEIVDAFERRADHLYGHTAVQGGSPELRRSARAALAVRATR